MSEVKMQTKLGGPVAIRAINDETAVIHGRAVLFGTEHLDGLRFDEVRTDFWDTEGKTGLPMLFDHGEDELVGLNQLGATVRQGRDQVGVWFEAQLERKNQYVDAVLKLVDEGVLGVSSGAVAHMVRIDHDGTFTSWPLAEVSLTPIPADPQMSQAFNEDVLGPGERSIRFDMGETPELVHVRSYAGRVAKRAATGVDSKSPAIETAVSASVTVKTSSEDLSLRLGLARARFASADIHRNRHEQEDRRGS